MAGVKKNSGNGLGEVASSFVSSMIIVIGCILFFSFARPIFPMVYQGEATEEDQPPRNRFGWTTQAWNEDKERLASKAGLDCAMLITFTELAQTILRFLGIPMLVILGPIHLIGSSAGNDYLSMLGINNLEPKSDWFWAYVGFVWYTVYIVMRILDDAMGRFMVRRHQWLKDMPYPRSLTVLVDEIPEGKNNEEALKLLFDREVFGRSVISRVFIVKNTKELTAAQAKVQRLDEAIDRASGGKSNDISEQLQGQFDRALPVLVEQKKVAQQQVARCQSQLTSSTVNNMCTAFVEFQHRRDKVIALKMFGPADNEEIVIYPPPDEPDVRWQDMMVDPVLMQGREAVGNALAFGLFIVFIPLVIFVQSIVRMDATNPWIPGTATDLSQDFPTLTTIWNGVAGSLVLSTLMGIVPFALMLIFDNFYKITDNGHVQLLVQTWYFVFLLIFVLLITAIGNSLIDVVSNIIQHPLQLLDLLANSLPDTTHFYICYMCIQFGPDATALIRLPPLVKFNAAKAIKGEAEAKALAEPEDQTVQGIGARSARLTILLVIPLVFCTMCPIMCFFAMMNFWLARLIYSYLFGYAETRKGDLGGEFYCQQIEHIQYGLVLYVLTMVGVLFQRAPDKACGWIAAGSLIVWFRMYRAFYRAYHWESLDFKEVSQLEQQATFNFAKAIGIEQAQNYPYLQDELKVQNGKSMSIVDAIMYAGGGVHDDARTAPRVVPGSRRKLPPAPSPNAAREAADRAVAASRRPASSPFAGFSSFFSSAAKPGAPPKPTVSAGASAGGAAGATAGLASVWTTQPASGPPPKGKM